LVQNFLFLSGKRFTTRPLHGSRAVIALILKSSSIINHLSKFAKQIGKF